MRIIAIGNRALMDGFAIIGVETYVDADRLEIEKLLNELVSKRQRALIYLQQDLELCKIPAFQKLRNEGGDILVCEIPALHEPANRHTTLDSMITRVMGASVLDTVYE